jgi:hypothetical protein
MIVTEIIVDRYLIIQEATRYWENTKHFGMAVLRTLGY